MMNKDRMLNEDLVAQMQANVYKTISVGQALRVARLSPDWDDSQEKSELRLVFPDQAQAEQYIEKLKTAIDMNGVTYKLIAPKQGGDTLKVTFPEKQFGQLAGALKKKRVQFVPKRQGDTIEFVGQPTALKNIYLVWKALTTKSNPASVALVSADSDPMTDDQKKEFASMFSSAGAADTTTGVKLNVPTFKQAVLAYQVKAVGKADAKFEGLLVDETTVLNAEQVKDFRRALIVLNDVTANVRLLLTVADNELRNQKSLTDIIREFVKMSVSLSINDYQTIVDINKNIISNPNESNEKKSIAKQKLEALPQLSSVKTLDQLSSIVKSLGATNDVEQKLKHSIPTNPTNPCAKRRLKLFHDAESLGAEIYGNDEWIIAITKSRQQNHVFGRLKPKVIAGTNNIDPNCNLNDNEGIAEPNRRRRDDSAVAYVKDHLPGSADNNRMEANWCTTGALNSQYGWSTQNTASFWDSYTKKNCPGAGVYVQIMEVASGMMYQYAPLIGNFEYEKEGQYNIGICNTAKYGSGKSGMANIRKAFPRLSILMDEVDRVCGEETLADKIKRERGLIEFAAQHGMISENGRLILSDSNPLLSKENRNNIMNRLKPIFYKTTGILVDMVDATSLFAGLDIEGTLPTIDCIKVVNASKMFGGMRMDGELKLKNTGNIKNMESMFEGSTIQKITGLDTHSAKTLAYAFTSVCPAKGESLVITGNTLDLSSCKDISFAFNASTIGKIKFENETPNLTKAVNVFVGCWKLTTVPNLKLTSIKSIYDLYSQILLPRNIEAASAQDVKLMFMGCSSLPDDALDEYCQTISDNLTHGDGQVIAEIDERGFLILRTSDDVQRQKENLHKFKGLLIANTMPCQMFDDIILKTPQIDMAGVMNADKMFYKCTLDIGKFINTDKTITLGNMFYKCNANAYPTIDFPNATDQNFKVFTNTHPPKKMPVIHLQYKYDPSRQLYGNNYPQTDDDWSYISHSMFPNYESSATTSWSTAWGTDDNVINHITKPLLDDWSKRISAKMGSIISDCTKDNKLIINTPEHFSLLQQAFKQSPDIVKSAMKVEEIVIDVPVCNELFTKCGSSSEYLELPKLTFTDTVTSAVALFKSTYVKLSQPIQWGKNLVNGHRMFAEAHITFADNYQFGKTHLTTAKSMFYQAQLDGKVKFNKSFSSAQDCYQMFYNAKGNAELSLADLDLQSATNISGCFNYSYITLTDDTLKFAAATDASYAFYQCRGLRSKIKLIDLPNCQDTESLFGSAGSLQSVGRINLPVCRQIKHIFAYAQSLTSVGVFNAPNVRDAYCAFEGCTALKHMLVPKFSALSYEQQHMFRKCPLHRRFGVKGQVIVAYNRARRNAANG